MCPEDGAALPRTGWETGARGPWNPVPGGAGDPHGRLGPRRSQPEETCVTAPPRAPADHGRHQSRPGALEEGVETSSGAPPQASRPWHSSGRTSRAPPSHPLPPRLPAHAHASESKRMSRGVGSYLWVTLRPGLWAPRTDQRHQQSGGRGPGQRGRRSPLPVSTEELCTSEPSQ